MPDGFYSIILLEMVMTMMIEAVGQLLTPAPSFRYGEAMAVAVIGHCISDTSLF